MDNEMMGLKSSMTQGSKGVLKILVGLVLAALFVFLAAQAYDTIYRGGKDAPVQNTIMVNASAKRLATPDTAETSFTIRKENASLVVARDEVSKLSNKVVAYLKSQGVDEKDITSSAFNIYPQEVYDSRPCVVESGASTVCPPRKTVKTYVVEASYNVKIKNLDKVGDILAGVSDAGVNQTGSLRFTVNDETTEKLYKEARAEAIEKAKADAKVLANNLDVRLVDLLNFNESGGGPRPMYYDKMGMGGEGLSVAASPSPMITPGQNEIMVNVSLVYETR